MKGNVRRLAYVVLAGLAAICVYLAVIPPYISHVTAGGGAPADPRINAREKMIKRGDILDRNGQVLARSVPVEGGFARQYPMGGYTAHILGYQSERYGSTGIEKSRAAALLGMNAGGLLLELRDRAFGLPGTGSDITLTIDVELQKHTVDLLKGNKGAVVVMNPSTGEVLALASYPVFDPYSLQDYVDDPASPLLNRATQGAYPPGSVFKIITAAAVLENLSQATKETVNCSGSLEVEGFKLKDNAIHGMVNFQEAFVKSCNVAFGHYGLELGPERLLRKAGAFGLGQKLDFPLPIYRGSITSAEEMDGPVLASSAIGQGEILMSPLQAALLACAVANEGQIMKPYLVSGQTGTGGGNKAVSPQLWLNAMDPSVAGILKEEMMEVVRNGTGRAAALPGVIVAGKTGSAENPHGKSHAWFVGFAPAEEPQIAVAVILENKGSGGAVAAPLAREVIRRALQ